MTKPEINPDRESKPEDSAPSLPQRDSFEDVVISSRRRTPIFIKGGVVMGIVTGTVLGATYLLNHAYNDDQKTDLSHKVTEFRKVDGVYAHTVITKSNSRYGKDSIKVERNTWNKSTVYIGYKGCSSVDEIVIHDGVFGTGNSLRYERSKDGELKKQIFNQADMEMEEQCQRFKSLMINHL